MIIGLKLVSVLTIAREVSQNFDVLKPVLKSCIVSMYVCMYVCDGECMCVCICVCVCVPVRVCEWASVCALSGTFNELLAAAQLQVQLPDVVISSHSSFAVGLE